MNHNCFAECVSLIQTAFKPYRNIQSVYHACTSIRFYHLEPWNDRPLDLRKPNKLMCKVHLLEIDLGITDLVHKLLHNKLM